MDKREIKGEIKGDILLFPISRMSPLIYILSQYASTEMLRNRLASFSAAGADVAQ